MALKYCEFEPSQHRNKRAAQDVWLDEPDDPHPLAICDVCASKLKKMRPSAIVMTRKEFEERRKSGTPMVGEPEAEADSPPAEAAAAPGDAAGDEPSA